MYEEVVTEQTAG